MFLDQLNFPRPSPFLNTLLAQNSLVDVSEFLEPNEYVDAVPFGEPFLPFVAMLAHPNGQIARYAGIKRAMALAGHEIHEIPVFFAQGGFPLSRE